MGLASNGVRIDRDQHVDEELNDLPEGPGHGGARTRSGLGGHQMQVLGTRLMGSSAFWGRGVARSMIAAPTNQTHPERLADFVAAFADFGRVAATATVRTLLTRSPGLATVLPNLRVPTTILMGAQDALYPVDAAMPLARLAPEATIEVVPDCGHLASALVDWLARADPAAGTHWTTRSSTHRAHNLARAAESGRCW